MYKKVLIAEDFDSINIAVKQTLEEMGVQEIHYAYSREIGWKSLVPW
jgi:hypothetical protein